MKIGDLIRYIDDGDIGIIIDYLPEEGYYKVLFKTGMVMDDLLYSELEVINEFI